MSKRWKCAIISLVKTFEQEKKEDLNHADNDPGYSQTGGSIELPCFAVSEQSTACRADRGVDQTENRRSGERAELQSLRHSAGAEKREEQNSRPCDGETLQRLRQLLRPDPSGRMFPAGLPAADRHHALQCGRGTAGAGEPDLATGGRDLLYAETVSGGLSERHRKERLSGSAAELGGSGIQQCDAGSGRPAERGGTENP